MLALVVVSLAVPGGAFVVILIRIRNSGRRMVQIARTDVARADALRGAAVADAQVVRRIADTAMSQTDQALGIAGKIETVDQNLVALTDYLVDRIEGRTATAPPRVGRHSRPELTAGEVRGERTLP
jgi:hypothetical protein